MNILIVNQPLGNRGDESAHKALVRALSGRFPQAEILELHVDANQDSIDQFDAHLDNVHYLNVKALPLSGFFANWCLRLNVPWLWRLLPSTRRLLKVYEKSDVVIGAPGGICMGGFQYWGHVRFLKYAQFVNKPLVYYGRSFGPFPTKTIWNRRFKKVSLEMLHYFAFCAIRDSKTEKLAKELKINYTQTVDTAFLDSPQCIVPDEVLNAIGSDDYVVFVPNLLIWHYAYRGRITKDRVLHYFSDILRAIEEKFPNHRVVMLPQTFNSGDYNGDDINFFKDLQAFVDDPNVVVIADTYSSDIQQSIIAKCACMVGARYHSVVFSINQAIPFVALSYEHKISGLLETLGKCDCMVDITHALDSEESVRTSVAEFKQKLDGAKADPEARANAKRIASACFDQLVGLICKLE